jgi:23S rRNA (cytidine1920-2'-O)/16S rRNA (cytidine1409-2'-O)-methyltransferase
MRKVRADRLLVERGLAPSRARAQAAIAAGNVVVADRVVAGAAEMLPHDAPLIVRAPAHPYASRGGLKLAHALDHFGIDPAGAVALDLGASTGGFTDVLLKRGAARVYAVDVGRGQLAPGLAADPRVIVRDGVNARALSAALVPEAPDIVVCDVSFISLTLALPPALDLARAGARLVALVKPQFEVGRALVGKGGIVRDAAVRAAACEAIADWLGVQPGWRVDDVTESPVRGGSGNVEFLLAAHRLSA